MVPSPGIFSTRRSVDISGGWRAKSQVSGEEYRAPRAEARDFRTLSLLDEFSISEIWARKLQRPVAFPQVSRLPLPVFGGVSTFPRVSGEGLVWRFDHRGSKRCLVVRVLGSNPMTEAYWTPDRRHGATRYRRRISEIPVPAAYPPQLSSNANYLCSAVLAVAAQIVA